MPETKPKRKTPKCFGYDNAPDKCGMCIFWDECLEAWAERVIMRKPKGGQEWKP